MERLIISPPVGNYLSWPGATSVIGTYTSSYRAGFWLRLWKIIKTLRYNWRAESWTNKLGLPNPGIRSIKPSLNLVGRILSIHGFHEEDWTFLANFINRNLFVLALEFNISCPNVNCENNLIRNIKEAIYIAQQKNHIIVKLPPVKWMQFAEPLYYMGIRHFHCCNTIPSPGGGISGKLLKQYSLWCIEELRKKFANSIKITGGGGINSISDLNDYFMAGADHFSITSMLLNPLNWVKVPKFIDWLDKIPGK